MDGLGRGLLMELGLDLYLGLTWSSPRLIILYLETYPRVFVLELV